MYSIQELSRRTSLDINFIRKCINTFKHVLEPHIQRGDKNKLLFNDNALIIFDKIGQMKQGGLALPAIKKQFNHDFKTVQTESNKDTQTGMQSVQSYNKELLEKIFELQQRLSEEQEKRRANIEERDKRILELEKLNQHLTDTLKLLPEGKTPEEIKKDWETEQEKKTKTIKIVSELKNINSGIFSMFNGKNKKLIKSLEETL